MLEERHLQINAGQHPGIYESFAWLLQKHDDDFAGATMIKATSEQVWVTDDQEEGGGHYEWVASILGTIRPQGKVTT